MPLLLGYRPLLLDVWVPASPTSPPLVVWIHGGAWMLGDRRYLRRRCGQTNSSRRLWPQGRYQLTGSSRTPLTGPSPRKVRSATDAAKDKFGKRRNSAGRATDISRRASCWPRH